MLSAKENPPAIKIKNKLGKTPAEEFAETLLSQMQSKPGDSKLYEKLLSEGIGTLIEEYGEYQEDGEDKQSPLVEKTIFQLNNLYNPYVLKTKQIGLQ